MSVAMSQQDRTRAFARVLGPALLIIACAVALRAPDAAKIIVAIFDREQLLWIIGSLSVVAGLIVVAFHNRWSSPSAAIVSLIGWLMLVRGVALLAAPMLLYSAAATAGSVLPIRLVFAILALVGLYLAWVGWRPGGQTAPP